MQLLQRALLPTEAQVRVCPGREPLLDLLLQHEVLLQRAHRELVVRLQEGAGLVAVAVGAGGAADRGDVDASAVDGDRVHENDGVVTILDEDGGVRAKRVEDVGVLDEAPLGFGTLAELGQGASSEHETEVVAEAGVGGARVDEQRPHGVLVGNLEVVGLEAAFDQWLPVGAPLAARPRVQGGAGGGEALELGEEGAEVGVEAGLDGG